MSTTNPTEVAGHDHEDERRCETCWNWDPLAHRRAPSDPPLDVLLSGTVFHDLIFTGLELPKPGEEQWATGMGSCPGGIANLAVAASRLGLRTGLVAGFGDDVYADWLWSMLADQEGIDLSASPRFEHFHTSITVSMAVAGDRAMLTHGHDLPEPLDEHLRRAPAARTVIVDLDGNDIWWRALAERGSLVIADVGFDGDGVWDPALLEPLEHCHVFTPNAVEAMAYTRADSPLWAAKALADRVPLVIVTEGAQGAVAIDSVTGEEARVSAVPVNAIDATGAGDVFGAAVAVGLMMDWDLTARLRFAALCAALSVQQFGGSLAAPGWGDLSDWFVSVRAQAVAGDPTAERLAYEYGFLGDVLPKHRVLGVRRAEATFAVRSDARA